MALRKKQEKETIYKSQHSTRANSEHNTSPTTLTPNLKQRTVHFDDEIQSFLTEKSVSGSSEINTIDFMSVPRSIASFQVDKDNLVSTLDDHFVPYSGPQNLNAEINKPPQESTKDFLECDYNSHDAPGSAIIGNVSFSEPQKVHVYSASESFAPIEISIDQNKPSESFAPTEIPIVQNKNTTRDNKRPRIEEREFHSNVTTAKPNLVVKPVNVTTNPVFTERNADVRTLIFQTVDSLNDESVITQTPILFEEPHVSCREINMEIATAATLQSEAINRIADNTKKSTRMFVRTANKLKSKCSKIKKGISKFFTKQRIHPAGQPRNEQFAITHRDIIPNTNNYQSLRTTGTDERLNIDKTVNTGQLTDDQETHDNTITLNIHQNKDNTFSTVCYESVDTHECSTINTTADQHELPATNRAHASCDQQTADQYDLDAPKLSHEPTADHLGPSPALDSCIHNSSSYLYGPTAVNDAFISLLEQSTIPLNTSANNISVLGNICGQEFAFLIDTGANVSAIRAGTWNQLPAPTKHPPLPTQITSVKSVSGQLVPVLGQVNIPFEIDGKIFPFDALVIDSLAYDAILGRDFLEHYKAKLDLSNHTIQLNDNLFACEGMTLPPTADQAAPLTCPIHAKASFIVPPRTEVVVPGQLDKPFSPHRVGIVEPKSTLATRYYVIGAAQIVKVWDNNCVPIRILNPTNQPVRIYRRTCLGNFTLTDSEIATFDLIQSDIEAEAEREVPTPLDVDPHDPLDTPTTGLTDDQQVKLKSLLKQYDDVFAHTPDQLGRSSVVKHTIDTGTHPPIRLRSYRTSPPNKEEINKQINEMLENDIISPSVSPWSAPVVLVKKSDGSMRFCVDYRKLNSITRKDSHPLPRITEALDALGGAQYFSTLDLRSGYWQIAMDEESKQKTAFITHNGLYEFNVLPFGLCNSPATFQRLMTHILRGLEWSICLVYIDDLIIFSRTFDEHITHLEQVFKRLREANVRLKPSKCHFVKPQVEYLGHVVSKDGLSPNPDKIKAVRDFPIPTNTTGVKAFLGLCNYYRRFIKGFAQIAAPLNRLTSKNVPFQWTNDCQQALDHLKQALISAPILAYPDFSLPFHLYVDASQTGIGLTLGQIVEGREVAIAYAGRDFNQAERNYSATEREALAVIDGIKRFQPYLYGQKFTIHTDHNALKWLMSIQDPTGRVARWSLLIQQFDFDIVHRPGKSNGNADGLSRRSYGTINLNALDSAGLQTSRIFEFQRKDQDLSDIISYLEHDSLPYENVRAKRILLSADVYYLDDHGILYHLNTVPKKGHKPHQAQLVLPPPLRYEVLVNAHDDLAGGHLGVFKTYEKLRDRFYWRGMYKDVEHWVRSCTDCATRKSPRNQLRAPLLPIPVEGAFDRLAVDCLGPLPVTWSGNRYLVVFTEYLSKWPEIFAVPNIDAVTIAKLLTDEIIPRHGAPRTLLSDRGKNFLSNLVLEVCKLYSIKKLNTTAYHPQTDGLVERLNSTLCQTLSMYVSQNQKDWDLFIPAALLAFRTSPSESTGETPFYLLYGREPRLPMDVSLLPPADPASSIIEHRRRIVKQIEQAQTMARENIQRAQQKMKTYYDRTARDPDFQEGMKVWVYTPKRFTGLSKKLLHNFHGPFRIIEKLSPVHFRLRTCNNKQVTTIVHANRMKHFVDPNDRPIESPTDDPLDEPFLSIDDLPLDSFDLPRATPALAHGRTLDTPAPITHHDPIPTSAETQTTTLIDNETIFNAEKLLRSRKRNGQLQYLVKWAGYPLSDATWEPSSNILDPRLLDDFHARNRDPQ